ncbi:10413_t:CDS:1, partial [Ambispora gerdemannii]
SSNYNNVDLCFDEKTFNLLYDLTKQTPNEYKQIEASVDWLASDIDQSEVESVWTIPTDEAEDIDYYDDISTLKVEEPDHQCVIIDTINDKVQKFPILYFRSNNYKERGIGFCICR